MNRFFRDPLDGGGGEPPQLTPEELAEQEAAQEAQKQQDALKAEAYDEQGVLKEGYVVDDQGVLSKVDPAPDPNEGNDDDTDFFEVVESITGEKYEVEYGDTAPDTPEGVAKYIQTVKKQSIAEFEKILQETMPDAYAYMLHTQMGGTKEEFFDKGVPGIPAREEFERSADAQAAMIRKDYTAAGIPTDVIEATIDKYIKDNELKKRATDLYDKYEEAQARQLDNIRKQKEADDKAFSAQVGTLMNGIDSIVNSNEIKFLIPEAKKAEFSNYVKERVQYSNGQFFLTQPITGETLSKIVESMFVNFQGNNLKALIEKEAGKVATKKLKLRVEKDAARERNQQQPNEPKKGFLPLSHFFPAQE